MLKRIFILVLALCCAFSFICQPVSGAEVVVALGVGMIGMAIAGAFGLYFASPDAYEAFGNNIHNSVISVGSAGTDWWNRASMGFIQLANLDFNLRSAIWAQAEKAADTVSETEQGTYTFTFTATGYLLNPDGSIDTGEDYRGKVATITSSYNISPAMIQYVVQLGTADDSRIYSGIYFYSYYPFYKDGRSASFDSDSGIYSASIVSSSGWVNSWNRSEYYRNYEIFTSWDDFYAYRDSLLTPYYSGTQSAGGATAAYPTYGYDGVNLPDIDVAQAGLVAEDGTCTISDLIAQLQSGAITWEDYIGTVAPGQTATITLTDADGATATYTLTNTGVGEKVETGTEPGEETQPVIIPPGSEIVGDNAVSLLQSIGNLLTDLYNNIVTLLQSIYNWCVEVGKSIKAFYETVIAKIQAVYEAVVEWLTAVRDAIVQLGIQVGEFITTAVQTMVTTIETWVTKVWEAVLAIPQAIADVLTAAFVISDTFLQTKVDALVAKYPYLETFRGLGSDLKGYVLSLGTQPPIIYIDLGSATGSYAWGGRIVFIDLTWYAQYKPTVDNLVGGFIWLWFAWRLFLSVPGLIQGMSGTWSQPDSVPDAPFRAWPQTHNHLDSGNKRLPPGSRHKDKGE